jgi:hypothetical protein
VVGFRKGMVGTCWERVESLEGRSKDEREYESGSFGVERWVIGALRKREKERRKMNVTKKTRRRVLMCWTAVMSRS